MELGLVGRKFGGHLFCVFKGFWVLGCFLVIGWFSQALQSAMPRFELIFCPGFISPTCDFLVSPFPMFLLSLQGT